MFDGPVDFLTTLTTSDEVRVQFPTGRALALCIVVYSSRFECSLEQSSVTKMRGDYGISFLCVVYIISLYIVHYIVC